MPAHPDQITETSARTAPRPARPVTDRRPSLLSFARSTCTATTTIGVLALAGVASAAPNAASTTVFFSDSRPLASSSDDLETLRRMTPLACAAAPAGTAPHSLADALSRVQTYLGAHESAAGLTALRARPELKNAMQAQALAVAAIAANKPSGALVALVAAHSLAPNDPVPLVNAAGVLNSLFLYREALALLDAADATKGDFGHPMGLSGVATALNNRGYALSGLGRHAQAEAVLRKAITLEPLLAEAKTNLARTLSCEGKETEALRYLRLGQRRSPPGTQAARDVGGGGPAGTGGSQPDAPENGPSRRPAASSFDLSAGREGTLPDLDVPQDPNEAIANLEVYQVALKEYQARIEATNAREDALKSRIRARTLNMVTQQRTDDILTAVYTVDAEPGIAALRSRINRSSTEAGELWGAFFTGEGGGATITKLSDEASRAPNYDEAMRALCVPAMRTMHDRWRTVMEGLIVDVRTYHKATSRIQSGLVANLGDPDQHALAVLAIAAEADTLYYSDIVTEFATVARQEQIAQEHCVDASRPVGALATVAPPKTSTLR